MNLQLENTNSKGDFVLKHGFKHWFSRFLVNKKNPTQIGKATSINKHLG